MKDYSADWRKKRRISNLILLAALLPLLLAVFHASKTAWYFSFGQKAIGIVVDVQHSGSFHPVVEYRTESGDVRRHRGNAVADGDYVGGEQVSIRYFEGDAKAAIISSGFSDTWLVAFVWTVIGLAVGIVGLFMHPGR